MRMISHAALPLKLFAKATKPFDEKIPSNESAKSKVQNCNLPKTAQC